MSVTDYMTDVLGAAAEKHVPGATAITKADQLPKDALDTIVPRLIPAMVVGVLGAIFWKKHRVLGFLGGSAVGGSLYPLYKKDYKGAGLALATTGAGIGIAMTWKKHPAIGYIAGDIGLLALTAPLWVRR